MSDKLSYEITITDKLNALPVPDLSDAIWGRIKAQLDIDLPTDEGNAPPDAPLPGDLLKGLGLSVIFIAIIFFLLKPASKQDTENYIPAVQQRSNPYNADSITTTQTPLKIPGRSAPVNATLKPAPEIAKDSAGLIKPLPVIVPTSKDSAATVVTAPIVNLPLPSAVTPDTTRKKPRGVQGIKPDDYRIEPKKKDNR